MMRRGALSLGGILVLLAGCSSDYGLQYSAWEPELSPAGTGNGGGEAGRQDPPPLSTPPPIPPSPWGDLDPGELPDVHFAVAYGDQPCDTYDDYDWNDQSAEPPPDLSGPHDADSDGLWGDEDWGYCYGIQVAVIDLQGQVVAEFPLPDVDPWAAEFVSLETGGPGQFLAAYNQWPQDPCCDDTIDCDGVGCGDCWDCDEPCYYGPNWTLWRGDAYSGGMDSVATWLQGSDHLFLTQSGRSVPVPPSYSLNVNMSPLEPDWLNVWSEDNVCASLSEGAAIRRIHLGAEGLLSMPWRLDELLADQPNMSYMSARPFSLDLSLDEEGNSQLLVGLTPNPCIDVDLPEGEVLTSQVVAVDPSFGALWQAPVAPLQYPAEATFAGWSGGGALTIGGTWDQAGWQVDQPEYTRTGALADDRVAYRAGPMLDPASASFAVVATREDWLGDSIDIYHDGERVWTIPELRFGLQGRPVFLEGVVLLPELPELPE